MKEDEAQSHIHKLLDSLNYLHSKKIVHRDLKLANILINDCFDIKLADFGLSKNYQESLLQSRTGTPLTMAPQILLGSGEKQVYTEKCDTWSLGVISYLLIYGDYPFKPGRRSNIGGIQGLRYQIKNCKQIFFPRDINISPLCKDFIILCLKVNPKERPYITQLMDHEWMKSTSLVSTIRIVNMKNVLGVQSPVIDQFKYLLYSEVKYHIVSIIKKAQ